jgi:hypothetical protein
MGKAAARPWLALALVIAPRRDSPAAPGVDKADRPPACGACHTMPPHPSGANSTGGRSLSDGSGFARATDTRMAKQRADSARMASRSIGAGSSLIISPGVAFTRISSLLVPGGDKLRPVVAAQVLGYSIVGDGRFDRRDHIDGPDRPRRMNRQALPGVVRPAS